MVYMANDQKPWGCLVRLFWMLAGNAILVVIAAKMATAGGISLPIDVGFWLTVLLIVAARFVDIRYFEGRDEFGNAATMRDWRRHAIWVVSIATLIWLLIRIVAAVRG